MKSSSLPSLAVLVVAVFALQKFAGYLREVVAPEGNLLKLMVIGEQILTILAPVILFLVICRLPPRQSLGLHRPPWKKFFTAIFLGFALMLGILRLLPILVPPSPEYVQTTNSLVSYRNVVDFFFSFVGAVVVASIADETFFRGVLLQGVKSRYGVVAAVLVTALLTALFHPLEPFKLIHSFLMAAIFAASVVWTNSVYTSMVLHSLHNALALIPPQ